MFRTPPAMAVVLPTVSAQLAALAKPQSGVEDQTTDYALADRARRPMLWCCWIDRRAKGNAHASRESCDIPGAAPAARHLHHSEPVGCRYRTAACLARLRGAGDHKSGPREHLGPRDGQRR